MHRIGSLMSEDMCVEWEERREDMQGGAGMWEDMCEDLCEDLCCFRSKNLVVSEFVSIFAPIIDLLTS